MEGFVKENSEENKMEEKKEELQTEQVEENKEQVEQQDKPKFKKANKKSKKIEKNMKEMGEKKKKKKWMIPAIIGIVLVLAGFFSIIFSLFNFNSDKIISGVSISGIDVSGLTKEEATAKIETMCKEKTDKELEIKYKDYVTTLNPTIMEVKYEAEKAAEEAYLIGRGDNIFVNNYEILFTLIGKKQIPVNMTLNEDVTKEAINGISVNLPGVIIESSYAVEDEELVITKGKAGVIIEVDKLLNEVKDYYKNIMASNECLEIPVQQKEPEEIDINKIHEKIYTEAKDAYYEKEPFTVYPEVNGVDFDVEEAKKILQEEKEEYVIPLKITKPNVTIDQIGTAAFPDRLSVCTTRYDATDVSRTTNLIIACQKINGKVVLPGETFSYNQALGPRTVANGYKNGKVYSNGQVVDGIGGGICQISSTLYNAVIKANLETVERRNHQFVTSYLPAGQDATVVYGMTDYKFKNTRKYPVRIVASSQSGIAKVEIFGIKEEKEYTFEFSTKVISTIPVTTKYVEDTSLPVGKEEVKQKGANGMKTETYLIKKLDGKVISTTLLSRDTYDAMARIIHKGTNKTTSSTPSTPSTTTPATPTTPTTPTTPSTPTTSTPTTSTNPTPNNPTETSPTDDKTTDETDNKQPSTGTDDKKDV